MSRDDHSNGGGGDYQHGATRWQSALTGAGGPGGGAAAASQRVQEVHMLDVARDIPKYSVCAFVGKRKSGKSRLMSDMLYNMRENFHHGISVCTTEEANPTYKLIMPDVFCFSNFGEGEMINGLIAMQKADLAAGRPRDAFVILDDCSYDRKVFRSNRTMRDLFMNGRHYRITLFVSTQYLMDFDPGLRGNIDFVFALKESNVRSRKNLFEAYFGNNDLSLNDFGVIFDTCTKDFKALVVNNCSGTMYWYLANTNLPRFRLGDADFWLTGRAASSATTTTTASSQPPKSGSATTKHKKEHRRHHRSSHDKSHRHQHRRGSSSSGHHVKK